MVVKYQIDGNTRQESRLEETTDYPVLAARVGDNELEFDPAAVSRTISEGDKGRNAGAPVTATGNHGTVRYTLSGTDSDQFEIDEKTGQITTSEDLDYEADSNNTTNRCDAANSCGVTVRARDSTGTVGATSADRTEPRRHRDHHDHGRGTRSQPLVPDRRQLMFLRAVPFSGTPRMLTTASQLNSASPTRQWTQRDALLTIR